MVPEQIRSILSHGFIEFHSLGFNAETLAFVGSILFAILGAIGQRRQFNMMVGSQSARGVSVLWTLSFTAMFIAILLYGIEQRSLGLIFTGLVRVVMYSPIIFGLWRYNHGFTLAQALLCTLYSIGLVAMALQADERTMFIAFNFLGIGMTLTQPLKMWWHKSVGVFSIQMLILYSGSTVFWLIYAAAFDLPTLRNMMSGFGFVYAVTFVTWLVYRNRPAVTPAAR